MKDFRGKTGFNVFKTIAKTVCVIMAVFTMALFGGCDLISSIIDLGNESTEVKREVKISPLSLEIEVGATATIKATSTQDKAISWTSDDEEVATVDDGEVTGVAEGTATVTASDGVKMAHCAITVIPAKNPDEGGGEGDEKDPPASKPTINISSTAISITEGDSYNLLATASDGSKVNWTSSNPDVATVVNGNVTGKAEGTAIVTATSETAGSATCKVTVAATPKKNYKLLWADEFDGNSLDMTKWEYQTGTQDNYHGNYGPLYWGNDELQYYTNGANLKVSDGALQITAKREQMGDRPFTSSRITTRDKYKTTYGIIEARMKTPAIQGMWPAFWMLPNPTNQNSSDNVYGGWAANGEIDIMEAKGRLLNKVDTTIHFGGPWPQNTYLTRETTLSSSTEDWHTYAVEWTADYIAWIIDGEEVYKLENSRWFTTASSAPSAPFDQPFYILLNLAVGGKYDPDIPVPADFQQATMYVDYVHVYQQEPVTE